MFLRKNLKFVAKAIPIVGSLILSAAAEAKDHGVFRLILRDGRAIHGRRDAVIPASALAGSVLQVRGTYVEFDVDPETLAVLNYTVTGAPAPTDITGRQRTQVFARKDPLHGAKLTGPMSVRIQGEHLVIRRGGPGITMRIQADDSTQGGIFQMEASRPIAYEHVLGPDFAYRVDGMGRVVFTNGLFLGGESPEAGKLPAALRGQIAGTRKCRWTGRSRARMRMVLGEDAVEALLPAPLSRVASLP